MLARFQNFIEQHQLFDKSHRLLVAVSGGADSVVLLNLLKLSNYDITIAHCNFKLRAQESDDDETFVKQLANQMDIPIFTIRFDTLDYVQSKKISIEMAARELRYDWFNGLLKKHGFDRIVTGHHLNDSIETLLLNLCRGTGINGLKGIAPLNGNIARPLLFATRNQIESYTRLNNLSYRTDSSNQSDNYLRNIVRNQAIPALKLVNPTFEERMVKNFKNIDQAAAIYNWYIEQAKPTVLSQNQSQTEIDLVKLGLQPFKEVLLYELLLPFGFNHQQSENILELVNQFSGKTFYSLSHELLIDRTKIIIQPIKNDWNPSFEIPFPQDIQNQYAHFRIKVVPIEEFILDKSPDVACLDYQKLSFPLNVRNWEVGDFFYPLGMNQAKKISDFFIDTKIDQFQKEKCLIITNNDQIIWVVRHRIDNRFKVTDDTKTVLYINFIG
jgi:tRNA(Ile)-lysidine synthase